MPENETIKQVALAVITVLQTISLFVSSRNHAKLTKLQNGNSAPAATSATDKSQIELPLK